MAFRAAFRVAFWSDHAFRGSRRPLKSRAGVHWHSLLLPGGRFHAWEVSLVYTCLHQIDSERCGSFQSSGPCWILTEDTSSLFASVLHSKRIQELELHPHTLWETSPLNASFDTTPTRFDSSGKPDESSESPAWHCERAQHCGHQKPCTERLAAGEVSRLRGWPFDLRLGQTWSPGPLCSLRPSK